ncbi:DUF2782 domain-containing protein [Thiohalorhabdus sp.]|uniref:DUF2782 domain-containing protein n=1 Tax=Thiohalorhabdus sp. TaxID=3094134 RepID=UPI002FC296A8
MYSTFLRSAILLPGLFLTLPAGVTAQEQEGGDIPPEHRIAPGEGDPEVTIIQQKDMTITEYRSGGRVYMIKVDPDVGPPYYLVDRTGDGSWDRRMGPDIAVPQWTIFEW